MSKATSLTHSIQHTVYCWSLGSLDSFSTLLVTAINDIVKLSAYKEKTIHKQKSIARDPNSDRKVNKNDKNKFVLPLNALWTQMEWNSNTECCVEGPLKTEDGDEMRESKTGRYGQGKKKNRNEEGWWKLPENTRELLFCLKLLFCLYSHRNNYFFNASKEEKDK